MLRSMTGFGSGSATVGSESIVVELKSVNHKFCEVKVRTPRELAHLEAVIQKVVKERLARGAIDVVVKRSLRTSAGVVPTVDLGLAKEYRRVFADLAKTLALPDETTVRDIAMQPSVIRLEEPPTNPDDANQAAEAALTHALDHLIVMRSKEGDALKVDLTTRLDLVRSTVAEVKLLVPASVEDYRARLHERIAELSRGVPPSSPSAPTWQKR
jgi:uncharacterized protein (TIGR00255 family)